jgi:hypothetical protein
LRLPINLSVISFRKNSNLYSISKIERILAALLSNGSYPIVTVGYFLDSLSWLRKNYEIRRKFPPLKRKLPGSEINGLDQKQITGTKNNKRQFLMNSQLKKQ